MLGGFGLPMEESRFQYEMSALPQLQLFGQFPAGCTADPINNAGNELATASSRPMKRAREPESISKQQKLHISLNGNFCQDEVGHVGSIFNPNPVSTGLRLSYEEDERNSSITSGCDSLKAINPSTYPLTGGIQLEMDWQKELLDHYVKVQEENMMKGLRELNRRHTVSFINALEKAVGKKLHEKEIELENMNCRNKELAEKIRQVAAEAQSWQYRAKYNESVVNALNANLQQVIAQGAAQTREGCGDNEFDDAVSCINVTGCGNPSVSEKLSCRGCNMKEVSVLLLPCRHLCLCIDCEGLTDICPVCQAMKTTSIHVFMS